MFLVAAITGLLWWQRGRNSDVAGAADVLGLLFFELMFPSFRTLFASLFTFPDEYRMLTKERPSGMYKLSAYYIARTGADLPIEILYPTLFVVVVYWFGGLRPEAGAFFGNWLSILLVVLVAQAWGLLFGGLFMVPKTAQTVTTVIMLSLMLVGGYFVRDVPGWIGWLRFLSFVYWGNNLLTKIQFRHTSLTDCSQLGPNGGCLVVTDLQSALRLAVDPNEAVYPEVLVLLAMLIILRWATYIVLRWKTTSSQRNL
ncbi:ABC-2 type transporter-domain-containing protein [Haematococcus lacustris]